ncbi:hypothetical protein [Streptomyces olivaceiscleroticus]|uniref:Phage tail protein n=1 Tax=Streptomyces olivaceiscleroticus TaxID=68245 RepID=A0ABN1AG00_9ACTN
MRQDVWEAIQSFAAPGRIAFRELDESTSILVPLESGSPIVFTDMGDSVSMRTGLDLNVLVDYEEDSAVATVKEVISALTDGHAVERLRASYRDRLTPCGYKVEYPSGNMQERDTERTTRQYTVRLPVWNAG